MLRRSFLSGAVVPLTGAPAPEDRCLRRAVSINLSEALIDRYLVVEALQRELNRAVIKATMASNWAKSFHITSVLWTTGESWVNQPVDFEPWWLVDEDEVTLLWLQIAKECRRRHPETQEWPIQMRHMLLCFDLQPRTPNWELDLSLPQSKREREELERYATTDPSFSDIETARRYASLVWPEVV